MAEHIHECPRCARCYPCADDVVPACLSGIRRVCEPCRGSAPRETPPAPFGPGLP